MPKSLRSVVFVLIGLLLTACAGSSANNVSLNTLLKLDARRLTFVFFYTPG
jgi:hypothetical protein